MLYFKRYKNFKIYTLTRFMYDYSEVIIYNIVMTFRSMSLTVNAPLVNHRKLSAESQCSAL